VGVTFRDPRGIQYIKMHCNITLMTRLRSDGGGLTSVTPDFFSVRRIADTRSRDHRGVLSSWVQRAGCEAETHLNLVPGLIRHVSTPHILHTLLLHTGSA
jgi:hypothetical protein